MYLNDIWLIFLENLQADEGIILVEKKLITNVPFLYISSTHSIQTKIDETIYASSILATTSTKVTWKSSFIRQEHRLFVYQHRFFVPQQKMFCCGNLCEDCIRLKR